ncbi:MAG: hypothetical protein ABIA37_04050 [Candidatus Woesearchaeota archaeon]
MLKKKLRDWGSVLLLSLGLAGITNNAAAQTNPCQTVIERHQKKLRGGIFSKGCLEEYITAELDSKKHKESFQCIKSFIGEYQTNSCGKHQLYDKSLEALLRNITKGSITTVEARIVLYNQGMLNYQKRLEQVVADVEKTVERIKAAPIEYARLTDLSRKRALKQKVNSWKNYLKDLRVQAILITDQALVLKERAPASYFPDREKVLKELKDTDPEEGIKYAKQAGAELTKLSNSMAREDWTTSYYFFKNWKLEMEETINKLIPMQEKSMGFGISEGLKGKEWVKISYLDAKGNLQDTWASKEFSRDWGKNGTNYYPKIEKIDRLITEARSVSLTGEPPQIGIKKGQTSATTGITRKECLADLRTYTQAIESFYRLRSNYVKNRCAKEQVLDTMFFFNWSNADESKSFVKLLDHYRRKYHRFIVQNIQYLSSPTEIAADGHDNVEQLKISYNLILNDEQFKCYDFPSIKRTEKSWLVRPSAVPECKKINF